MSERPNLDRALLGSPALRASAAVFPPLGLLNLPEKVVQFGTGAFLRGFVEHFIDAANRAGSFNGRVVAISTTGSGRDDILNRQNGLYTLIVEGVENARPVREFQIVSSLSRAIDATASWDDVLDVARNPDVEVVFSNTTELGIENDPDAVPLLPPRSFPGKLTMFLAERARVFEYSPDAGLTIVPCELVEKNGERLRAMVLGLAKTWNLGAAFNGWVHDNVIFCNTLVDRIVPGAPSMSKREEVEDLLGYRDNLLTVCEPYRLFAIEGDQRNPALAFASADRGVVLTDDVEPYRLAKVRLLNGAHSLLAPVALQCGVQTVFEAVSDDLIGAYLRRTMYDELVPSLELASAGEFARRVVERFSNPYLAHSLFDITLQGTTKMRVRVIPSIVAFVEKEQKVPELIAFGFAASLLFLRGELHDERRAAGMQVPPDEQAFAIREQWRNGASPSEVARRSCADMSLWGLDLGALDGFAESVETHLNSMARTGVRASLEHFLFRAVTQHEEATS